MGDKATIKIPEDQMQQVIGAAILNHMSEEVKGDIISQALSWLTTPARSTYGDKKSPLMEAFEQSVREVANDTVKEVIASSEKFKQEVKKLATDSLDRWMEQIDDNLVETISGNILWTMADKERWRR